MYVGSYSQAGLGFSLKPPKWLRNTIINPIKQAVTGGSVTVPTPIGPVEVPVQNIPSTVSQASFQPAPIGPSTAPAMSPAQQAINAVPGGGKTILVAGALGIALLMFAGSRKRRRA